MKGLHVKNNFSDSQMIQAIDIIYEAFRKKIDKLELRPESDYQGKRIILSSIDREKIFILCNEERVVGGLGLQDYKSRFYYLKWSVLRKEFGF